MGSKFEATLRRLKPDKHRTRLAQRNPTELPFVETVLEVPGKVLFDTTVYIDVMQDRFPAEAEALIHATEVWHSPVCEMELAVSCGALQPDRTDAADVRSWIVQALENIPEHRRVPPSRDAWRAAGLMSGILGRLQGYAAGDSAQLVNDALLYYTARQHGLTLLTRNTRDFDLMQQVDPSVRVLFYRTTPFRGSGLPIPR